MVLLHHQIPTRKRAPPGSTSSSFVPPLKNPKLAATPTEKPPQCENRSQTPIDKTVSILAEAGCTLINPSGPPCLPSDHHKFRAHLNRLFSSSPSLRSDFLAGFSSYIQSSHNLRRVLSSPLKGHGLIRHLLLVNSIQVELQNMLLEKLPEYFDTSPEHSGTATLSLEDDMARLIINQFRWLDFVVDPDALTEKLMQVLSICPLHLKKEVIGSLPEIIGDQNNKAVVENLEQMLRDDSSVIVPVLDAFSNLNMDEDLQDQAISLALSCLRTIDEEHMQYLLRFLLLSARPWNARRIISQIREQLNFLSTSKGRGAQCSKLKGKSIIHHTEASILHVLRSSLLFNDVLCKEMLRELVRLDKAEQHKVIDIWLLALLHTKESMEKNIQKIFKKKIVENCIQEPMIDQCIIGNKDLVQEIFPSFLSLAEYLLACKEQKARELSIRLYSCLFEETGEPYYRQEVLGALVAHVGSGVDFEVNSALKTIALLGSKHVKEVILLSSHINGILDYLEDFDIDNIRKVYEVFSYLAAQCTVDDFGSSIPNELLMIIRKQVNHPDMKYKKIGLIGTIELVSCLGDAKCVSSVFSQKSNYEEIVELLQASLDSCKQSCLPLVLLYDELAALLDRKELQPMIVDWIGKHVGEFESLFLSDLDSGKLTHDNTYCGLEGELWMNLDGDVSPVCLSILPQATSSLQSSSSLQVLPAYFHLLSTVERITNQGSLGGIDALLGCPLHLPSSKYFSKQAWQQLTAKQKQILCLSLYYATNWIRELLNAFCSQVAGRFECLIQSTEEDISAKLSKRLRNLICLESLLNNFMNCHPSLLPELHLNVANKGISLAKQADNILHVDMKKQCKKPSENEDSVERKHTRISQASLCLSTSGSLRQPTIIDVLRKAGAVINQDVSQKDLNGQTTEGKVSDSADKNSCNSIDPLISNDSSVAKALALQRFKYRPLTVQCLSLLSLSKNQHSCCSDPSAELPLHLYLLRDLHLKLDFFSLGKQCPSRLSTASAGFTSMTEEQFLSNIRTLFPDLRRHLESAACTLKEGDKTCEEHWIAHSAASGNPQIADVVLSKSSAASVFREVLHCFSKMVCLPAVQLDQSVLKDLLEAFQPSKTLDNASRVHPCPSPGTVEYLFLASASFFEDLLDTTSCHSFLLASESLHALESLVTLVQTVADKSKSNGNGSHSISASSILTILHRRLGTSAQKLLQHNWDNESLENGWKNKGDIIQKILRIYVGNCESKTDVLHDLASSILPKVHSSRTVVEDDHAFPTLSNATFSAWYRVLHEVNLTNFNKLVKGAVVFMKPNVLPESVSEHLAQMQRSVDVIVSLVNLCRTNKKVTLHAMAIKYGGKYIDSFIKVFDFLQAKFQSHREQIIELLKELQKATRTMQTLCSDAKGMKQTAITSKIPATKRSMERFLFRVKGLLHTTSSGCIFWMGNLKHKDLMGQVISSQAYVDDENDSTEDLAGANGENEHVNNTNEDDEEVDL